MKVLFTGGVTWSEKKKKWGQKNFWFRYFNSSRIYKTVVQKEKNMK